MAKYNAPKPVFKKEPDERYTLRYKKTVEAYRKANFSYSPSSYLERRKDIVENVNIDLQRQWPEYVNERLVSIQRVLLPFANMFGLANGELDSKHVHKSAIVYKATVEIEDDNAKRAGYHKIREIEDLGAGSHTFTIGRYQRPIVEPTAYDRQGNVTDARIKSYYHAYWIEDKPQEIKSILKRYNTDRPVQGFIVAVANLQGTPYAGSYAMVSESDFENCRIEDIISGNRMGLPVKVFKEWETKKEQLLKGGIATKAQLDKLTDKDFVNLIHNKEAIEKGLTK